MSDSKITTDHDEIRRWVEKRGGHPAKVKGTGRGGDPQHRLTDPLFFVDLAAHHGEVEDRFIKRDLGGEIVAGDSHVIDPVQHHCPLVDPAALGMVADIPPGHHRGAGEPAEGLCQMR